ncbi:hypothetical protein Droror1_Dr00005018 [Drosera rotundifolia]
MWRRRVSRLFCRRVIFDPIVSTPPLALPAPAERNGSGILRFRLRRQWRRREVKYRKKREITVEVKDVPSQEFRGYRVSR